MLSVKVLRIFDVEPSFSFGEGNFTRLCRRSVVAPDCFE